MSSGCYCALTIATLLNLLTPELVLNVKEFIISCQTYEGGLASAATDDKNTSPLGEAHGGYTFCAIASYAIIDPLTKSIGGAGKKELNWNNLLRWASGLQAMPIEGGGFRGRTNKLVDGCYGWWGGGLFGLLDGLMSAENNGLENVDVYDRGQFFSISISSFEFRANKIIRSTTRIHTPARSSTGWGTTR